MNVASMKRPARTKNIEGMFLESGVWQSVTDALKAKDREKSRAEFQRALQTCMACHTAEKVGFLNDSPVFKRLGSFPTLAK
jgi:cytochrome c553